MVNLLIPEHFGERLNQINQLLDYFPWVLKADGKFSRASPLDDDELMEILDKARLTDIRKLMLAHGDSMRKYSTAQEYVEKLTQWHENVLLMKTLDKKEQGEK